MTINDPFDFAAARRAKLAAAKPRTFTIATGRKLRLRPIISAYGMVDASSLFGDMKDLEPGGDQLDQSKKVLDGIEAMLREFVVDEDHAHLAAELRDKKNPVDMDGLLTIINGLQTYGAGGASPLDASGRGAASSKKSGAASTRSASGRATPKGSKA